ncbi:uncharacterized protein [Asterias amurensis]|uniref:uncharacterized protein n=1 Tax=Asterias amurensis TaxID=7602 RepID=UPI003AB3112C
MANKLVIYLTLFALSAFVVMVTMAEDEAEFQNTNLLKTSLEKRSLAEVLLEKRAVPDTPTEGKGKRGKGKKGRKGRKGRGRGKGRGRKGGKGEPEYQTCVHHITGLACTCDMRFEHLRGTGRDGRYYLSCV